MGAMTSPGERQPKTTEREGERWGGILVQRCTRGALLSVLPPAPELFLFFCDFSPHPAPPQCQNQPPDKSSAQP